MLLVRKRNINLIEDVLIATTYSESDKRPKLLRLKTYINIIAKDTDIFVCNLTELAAAVHKLCNVT